MKNYRSQGTEIPQEWDLTSSETTKYHNTNIIALPQKDDEPQMYGYDVDEYTTAEYESRALEQNKADIAYVAIMTGVDL